MARRIPPFAALRAFEALARQGSLRDAGDELGVSASAISHQVKALEEHLGRKLLLREDGRLVVTSAGQRLADELGTALDRLEMAVQDASADPDRLHVTVNLYPSLAELWLIPLLARFRASHPDVHVVLLTNDAEADLSGSDIDLAIRYSADPPPGHPASILIHETLVPLCAPAYLAAFGAMSNPADVLHHPLIACNASPDEWVDWLAAQGLETDRTAEWLTIDTRSGALRAAQEGLGITLGRRPAADRAMASGVLVPMGVAPVDSGAKYWLVAPHRSWSLPKVRAFGSWLQAMAALDNAFVGDRADPH